MRFALSLRQPVETFFTDKDKYSAINQKITEKLAKMQ